MELHAPNFRDNAVELNNVAMKFHEWGSLAIAAAMYPDALQAMQDHQGWSAKRGILPSDTVKLLNLQEKITERRNLALAYSAMHDAPSSQFVEDFLSDTLEDLRPIALDATLPLTDEHVLAIISHNIAAVRFHMGQLDEAHQYLGLASSSLVAANAISDGFCTKTAISINFLLGKILIKRGKLSKAMKAFLAALYAWEETLPFEGCFTIRMNIIHHLHQTIMATGNDMASLSLASALRRVCDKSRAAQAA